MKLKIYDFLFLKLNGNFKHELSPSKPLLCITQSLILGFPVNIGRKVTCTMQKHSVWQVMVGLWQGDIYIVEIILDVKIEAFGMIARYRGFSTYAV